MEMEAADVGGCDAGVYDVFLESAFIKDGGLSDVKETFYD